MLAYDIRKVWTFPLVTHIFSVTDSSWVAVWQNGIWQESKYEGEICHWTPWKRICFTRNDSDACDTSGWKTSQSTHLCESLRYIQWSIYGTELASMYQNDISNKGSSHSCSYKNRKTMFCAIQSGTAESFQGWK